MLITFRLEEGSTLRPQWEGSGYIEPRTLEEADWKLFAGWIEGYRLALKMHDPANTFLGLGKEMLHWLSGEKGLLESIRGELKTPPLILEFSLDRESPKEHLPFLEVPWELLADESGHLAANASLQYTPMRRIGRASAPVPPSDLRLSMLFMTASPREETKHLAYEQEERVILQSSGRLGIDLAIEESGCLDLMKDRWAEENALGRMDVLHISCHGVQDNEEPKLVLEDKFGNGLPASAAMLHSTLGNIPPRLLFVSACGTAKPNADLNTLSADLLLRGVPAVLGWAGSVYDREATTFTEKLYGALSHGSGLEEAVALARHEMLVPADPSSERFRDWHLARLYLGAEGGGRFCTGKQARRLLSSEYGHKEFLDAKGKEITVASRHEFVGRRRQVQDILREFDEKSHAGVLLHGIGRQGKSSLAARIANRMPDHRLAVVFKHYKAEDILARLAEYTGLKAVKDIVNKHLDGVRKNPADLESVLTEILEDPCSQKRPVLLVIDDFERVLVDPAKDGGRHTVQSDLVPVYESVVKAFSHAQTKSRLLFTSRFPFALGPEGSDPAEFFHPIHLPPMEDYERTKQVRARATYLEAKAKEEKKTLADEDAERTGRCLSVASGNPGLQNILYTLGREAPEACDTALTEMEAYIKEGTDPTQDKARDFLEILALGKVLGVLNKGERELLRLSTIFHVPVPVGVLAELGKETGLDETGAALGRLMGLGLWDEFEDMVEVSKAVMVNALVRPKAGQVEETELSGLAGLVTQPLFQTWGGSTGEKRPYPADLELTRLALAAEDSTVLEHTAEDAVRFLEKQGRYLEAAPLGMASIQALDANQHSVPLTLLAMVAQVCGRVGEVVPARDYLQRAVQEIDKGGEQVRAMDPIELSFILKAHAERLVEEGAPDQALEAFQRAERLLEEAEGPEDKGRYVRDRAIMKGGIAEILKNKGEVEEALALHEERLGIFESLGDRRSRAMTLGDIAGLKAQRGEVKEALALHEEELEVYESLGDRHPRAVTLGEIARLKAQCGEVDAAIRLLSEVLQICNELGEKKGRAVTLGDIAGLKAQRGEVDAALALHEERLGIFESLGDRRERAVTLGGIARLKAQRGEVAAALALHEEELEVYESLGDRRFRSVTLGDIARLKAQRGEVAEALALHDERLLIFEHLNDIDGKANTLWCMGQIALEQGEHQKAFDFFAESYDINLNKLGRLDGIAWVGIDLGKMLCGGGKMQEGLAILARSRDGFAKLHMDSEAQQTQALMDHIQQQAGENGEKEKPEGE